MFFLVHFPFLDSTKNERRMSPTRRTYIIAVILLTCYVVFLSNIIHAPWMSEYTQTSKPGAYHGALESTRGGSNLDIANIDTAVQNEPFARPQITFTNYAWFHPDKNLSLAYSRTLAMRGLVDAIVENERYNASLFTDLNLNFDPAADQEPPPIISFLDIETCAESNWPIMVGPTNYANVSDLEDGRSVQQPLGRYFNTIESNVKQALRSPAMLHPDSRLVIVNCQGDGPGDRYSTEPFWGQSRDHSIYGKVVVLTVSAHKDCISHYNDFGIPPLPIKPVHLNETELDDIQNCRSTKKRKHLISFLGRGRKYFPEFDQYFKKLHNGTNVYAEFTYKHYTEAVARGSQVTARKKDEEKDDFYYNLLRGSVFVAAPRGDNLYSYRFSEVLSAGAIPVIYADNWVLPYTKNVIDWSEVALLLPQRNISNTLDVLKSIPDEKICQMQKRGLEVYNMYVKDSKARLRGILDVMDSKYSLRQNIMPSRRHLR